MTIELIRHLQSHDTPLSVPRTGPVSWDDEATHEAAHHADPRRYALSALFPGVLPAQRARVLLWLLTASWADLDGDARGTLGRLTRALTLGLPPADVLTVFLATRRRRANHKDEIVVLDAGRVLQRGSHADLVAVNGAYRTLWASRAIA